MADVDIDIPSPNPALAQILLGPKMRNVVRARTELAKLIYQAVVAKRTGALASSARVRVTVGPHNYKHDRPVGELIVGTGLGYGAAHEFGHGYRRDSATGGFVARDGKRRRGVRAGRSRGAKDLKTVLRSLRAAS